MKASKLPLLTLAALTVLSACAASPRKPDQTAAGVAAQGLVSGQTRPMTVAIAKQLVAAAVKASCSPPAGTCSGAFAIVDDAGVLVYLETIDGATAVAPELAIRKAKTPALYRRPTQVFLDAVTNKTDTSYADGSYPDMTTSPGGIPLFKDGMVVGAYGAGAVGNLAAGKQIDDAVAAEATRIFGKQ
jgi:glc operon protein GlcG